MIALPILLRQKQSTIFFQNRIHWNEPSDAYSEDGSLKSWRWRRTNRTHFALADELVGNWWILIPGGLCEFLKLYWFGDPVTQWRPLLFTDFSPSALSAILRYSSCLQNYVKVTVRINRENLKFWNLAFGKVNFKISNKTISLLRYFKIRLTLLRERSDKQPDRPLLRVSVWKQQFLRTLLPCPYKVWSILTGPLRKGHSTLPFGDQPVYFAVYSVAFSLNVLFLLPTSI